MHCPRLSSTAIGLTLPIVLVCGAVTSEESGQLPFPLGRYTTVTESEWNIQIDFEGDGTATVEIATWPPKRCQACLYALVSG